MDQPRKVAKPARGQLLYPYICTGSTAVCIGLNARYQYIFLFGGSAVYA